jgi:hypothetical protein
MSNNGNAAIAEKRERHILALSGGKDSAALAVYMRNKYPELELEYVFTDSGCELPETYDYLNRIRAVLNIEITVIKSDKSWEDYWRFYKCKHTPFGTFTYLPSPKERWCTEVLKLIPYRNWLEKNYSDYVIHSYVGLRADEKHHRKGFLAPSTNIVSHFPFIEDDLVYEDIIQILFESGLGLPGYYHWRKRSGCYFCFYQTKQEWIGLLKHHPELYMKAMQYETVMDNVDIRFTWCDDISLKELLEKSREILDDEKHSNKANYAFIDESDCIRGKKLNEILRDIF